ncbi:hypothetical protein [Sphingobacterium suaedae]|uniref:Uncharacterized protein n=1 Tax=Sphingobacterium suaedae TaxID=1686402 RepID=A0ABW5KD49_9SPHI
MQKNKIMPPLGGQTIFCLAYAMNLKTSFTEALLLDDRVINIQKSVGKGSGYNLNSAHKSSNNLGWLSRK